MCAQSKIILNYFNCHSDFLFQSVQAKFCTQLYNQICENDDYFKNMPIYKFSNAISKIFSFDSDDHKKHLPIVKSFKFDKLPLDEFSRYFDILTVIKNDSENSEIIDNLKKICEISCDAEISELIRGQNYLETIILDILTKVSLNFFKEDLSAQICKLCLQTLFNVLSNSQKSRFVISQNFDALFVSLMKCMLTYESNEEILTFSSAVLQIVLLEADYDDNFELDRLFHNKYFSID